MYSYSVKELEKIIEEKKQKEEETKQIKNKKKRMKTGKKAMWAGLSMCIILIIFSMIMVWLDKDTQTTSILGGAGVAAIPFIFGIYDKYSTEISIKNMDMNYIEDYDEKEGLY